MDKMMDKWGGGEVLRRAVRGMLPKNRLRDDRMARLKCFEGEAHPYKRNVLAVSEANGLGGSIGEMPAVKRGLARGQKPKEKKMVKQEAVVQGA